MASSWHRDDHDHITSLNVPSLILAIGGWLPAALLRDAAPFSRYYSARNKFERFRVFLELISRFEFEFCRCVNYFF